MEIDEAATLCRIEEVTQRGLDGFERVRARLAEIDDDAERAHERQRTGLAAVTERRDAERAGRAAKETDTTKADTTKADTTKADASAATWRRAERATSYRFGPEEPEHQPARVWRPPPAPREPDRHGEDEDLSGRSWLC